VKAKIQDTEASSPTIQEKILHTEAEVEASSPLMKAKIQDTQNVEASGPIVQASIQDKEASGHIEKTKIQDTQDVEASGPFVKAKIQDTEAAQVEASSPIEKAKIQDTQDVEASGPIVNAKIQDTQDVEASGPSVKAKIQDTQDVEASSSTVKAKIQDTEASGPTIKETIQDTGASSPIVKAKIQDKEVRSPIVSARTSWADLTASDLTCVAAHATRPEGALSPAIIGMGALCGVLAGSEQHAVHTLQSMVKKYVEVIPGWSCQEWTAAIKEVQTDLIEGSDVWWAAEGLAQHGGFDHVIKHRKAKGGGRQVHVTFKTESTTVMQYQFEVPNEDEEEALELAARIVIAQTVLAMRLHALRADARVSGRVHQARETTVMVRRLRAVFAAVFAPDAATRLAFLKGADEL
jgi:hypothetical protein